MTSSTTSLRISSRILTDIISVSRVGADVVEAALEVGGHVHGAGPEGLLLVAGAELVSPVLGFPVSLLAGVFGLGWVWTSEGNEDVIMNTS